MNPHSNTFAKYFFILLFTLPVLYVAATFVYFGSLTAWDQIKLYRLNHLDNSRLTQTYRHEATGITFKYPSTANVYKWFGTEEDSLRVFSDGNNHGYTCDIYINDPQRQPEKGHDVMQMNGLSWYKWTVLDDTGSFLDRHFVSWYAVKGSNSVVATSVLEAEGYCQAIVSTITM